MATITELVELFGSLTGRPARVERIARILREDGYLPETPRGTAPADRKPAATAEHAAAILAALLAREVADSSQREGHSAAVVLARECRFLGAVRRSQADAGLSGASAWSVDADLTERLSPVMTSFAEMVADLIAKRIAPDHPLAGFEAVTLTHSVDRYGIHFKVSGVFYQWAGIEREEVSICFGTGIPATNPKIGFVESYGSMSAQVLPLISDALGVDGALIKEAANNG